MKNRNLLLALTMPLMITVSSCKSPETSTHTRLASDETLSNTPLKIELSTDKQEILRSLGEEILLHIARFHKKEGIAFAIQARCRGCSFSERRERFKNLLSNARTPQLNQLVDQAIDVVLPDVIDQLLDQAPKDTKFDEKKLIEIFDQIDSQKGMVNQLGFKKDEPGRWSQYFASLDALRQNATEELLKDHFKTIDWDLVQESISVQTKIFALSPYDLFPVRLVVNTNNPKNDATYRALFFSRGANLWLSSVLSQHVLGIEDYIEPTTFDAFEQMRIPEGLPQEVYDDEAKYSSNDYETLQTIGRMMTQLELEEEKPQVINGLNMLALGLRYGVFKQKN
jgi:hypothetical protein